MESNIDLREQIILEAKNWLGTPFKHQGRLKHVGCDCIGLVSGVLQELGLKLNGKNIEEYDLKNYSRNPKNNILKTSLDKIFAVSNTPKVGDVILLKFLSEPQHVGFISQIGEDGSLKIIHGYMQAGKVVEQSFSKNWQKKFVKIYDIESGVIQGLPR